MSCSPCGSPVCHAWSECQPESLPLVALKQSELVTSHLLILQVEKQALRVEVSCQKSLILMLLFVF